MLSVLASFMLLIIQIRQAIKKKKKALFGLQPKVEGLHLEMSCKQRFKISVTWLVTRGQKCMCRRTGRIHVSDSYLWVRTPLGG